MKNDNSSIRPDPKIAAFAGGLTMVLQNERQIHSFSNLITNFLVGMVSPYVVKHTQPDVLERSFENDPETLKKIHNSANISFLADELLAGPEQARQLPAPDKQQAGDWQP